MSIELSIWEDTGPVSSGHGTTRTQVTNIGWKASGLDDATDDYAYSPLIRPQNGVPFTYSYKKYNYLKIEGTYAAASRPRIKFTGNYNGTPPDGLEGQGDIRIYYKLTNTYEQPNNQYDGELIYLEPGQVQVVYPTVSTVGPEAATDHPQFLNTDTTYYTQYLVTQVLVPAGLETEFGNIGDINIEWYIDEYEDTNT